jgi:NAD(P)-dependent dehydrogenase (short-subunit alcohol dehydrogenase family)
VVNAADVAADIPALETPVPLCRKVLDVNVIGTFRVAHAAARIMGVTGGRAIVNSSSLAGLRGGKGLSHGASERLSC